MYKEYKKLKYVHFISIHTFNYIFSLFVLKSFLFHVTSLFISIWQLSAILLHSSSSVNFLLLGLGQMHIFRFLQKPLIDVLEVGPLRAIHRVVFKPLLLCAFRVMVPLEDEPSVQSELLNALD